MHQENTSSMPSMKKNFTDIYNRQNELLEMSKFEDWKMMQDIRWKIISNASNLVSTVNSNKHNASHCLETLKKYAHAAVANATIRNDRCFADKISTYENSINSTLLVKTNNHL